MLYLIKKITSVIAEYYRLIYLEVSHSLYKHRVPIDYITSVLLLTAFRNISSNCKKVKKKE